MPSPNQHWIEELDFTIEEWTPDRNRILEMLSRIHLYEICLWLSQAFAAECLTIKYRDNPVCLDSFTCTDTPQSSFVRRVCYDAAKAYMLIKLKVTWYHYCAIDQATVSALLSAPSVGSYYNKNIRAGRFDCREHPIPAY